jgi:DnaJ homologue, subfamily C, member 28, conserved domain
VTERKPAGVRFETWVERQIRDAQERGEFENLPGAGKPLPGLTGHYDDQWWVKQVA